jgi:hypothetical protein
MNARLGLIFLIVSLGCVETRAGVYTDELSKCLVESTNSEDRLTLIRWLFVAIAQHPAVASLANAKPADVEKSSAAAGKLFTRLLAETCGGPAGKALKYEGPLAIQSSFQVLGQVAMSDLVRNEQVAKTMSDLSKHLDTKKLDALGKE